MLVGGRVLLFHRSAVALRQKSTKIIRNSDALTNIILANFTERQVVSSISCLRSVRNNPNVSLEIANDAVLNDVSLTWFCKWLTKAFSPNHKNLFPIIAPVPSENDLISAQAELAAMLFEVSSSHSKPGGYIANGHSADFTEPVNEQDSLKYTECSEFVSMIGEFVHNEGMVALTNIIKHFFGRSLSADMFLKEASKICKYNANAINLLLHILNIPTNEEIEEILKVNNERRKELRQSLLTEINEIVAKNIAKLRPFSHRQDKVGGRSELILHVRCSDKARKVASNEALKIENISLPLSFSENSSFRTDAPILSSNYIGLREQGLLRGLEKYASPSWQEKGTHVELASSVVDLLDSRGAAETPRGEEGETSAANRKVLLDNLPDSVTEEEIRHCLRHCGVVEKVWLYREEDKQMRRFDVPVTGMTHSEVVDIMGDLISDAMVPDALPQAARAPEKEMEEEQEGGKKKKKRKSKNPLRISKSETRQRLLKGVKSDSYAFVQMADAGSYDLISRDAVRLFGIVMRGHTCRVQGAQSFKSFTVEVGENIQFSEVVHQLAELLRDVAFSYRKDQLELLESKPFFVTLEFESHDSGWRAFQRLMKAHETRKIPLYPCWVKQKVFWELSHRLAKTRELDQKLPADLLDLYYDKEGSVSLKQGLLSRGNSS